MRMEPEAIETALAEALARASGGDCPPRLAAALRHAVFPAGKRLRPRLTLAVAAAVGNDDPDLAMAGAIAIELLHCASLVHDDLPCFDDAALRRGQPSVHAAFGEATAVLTGDALIVLAFETVACAAAQHPARAIAVTASIARAVGAPSGITAGQAWECEASPDLGLYHRAKTGALFAGAAAVGAQASGVEPRGWHDMGMLLGETFQCADDLADALASERELGKPVGRDACLGRPTAIGERGLEGAIRHGRALLERTLAAVPPCPGQASLRRLIERECGRLLPADARREPAQAAE